MRYLDGSLRALTVTFRNFFRPSITESVRPHETRAERYRASFALVDDEHGDEACIGCMLCEKICPSSVITVTSGPKAESPHTGKKRGWATDFTLDLQACIFCELCVQVCPTDAILMLHVQERAGYDREDLFLTMDRLYANGREQPLTWGSGNKLREMQDPKKGLPTPPPRERPPRKAAAEPAAAKPAVAEPAVEKPAPEKDATEAPAPDEAASDDGPSEGGAR